MLGVCGSVDGPISSRVPNCLAMILNLQEHVVDQATEIVKCRIMYQSLTVRLVEQLGIRVPGNLDKTDHLIVTQANYWIVDPSLVQTEPVVMRLAIRPNPETVP